MALSGTINGSVTLNSAAYNFYIDWSGVQSIAGNYTDITMKVYWSRNSGYFNEFDTVGERNASVTIGDSTFNWSQRFRLIPFSPNPYLIKEFTSRVNHNADGTKSVTISARANGYAATYGTSSNALSSGDCTASATVTLDTIPRASTATLSSASITAGNSITVNITPAAANTFNHDVKWTLGANQISVNLPVGTNSHTVTIPTSWCNSFPNANSSSVSCTVQTKQGNNTIGGLITKVFTLNVPAYTPSLSVSLAGQSLLSGEYVATKSRVVGTVTASSMYGASVSVKAVLDGKTYQVSAGSWTSSVLAEGTFNIVTTLTDSRGKTATDTKSITVRAYSPPYITTVSAVRCLSNGTVDENGTYAKVTFIGGCSSVNNKNSRIYKVNAVNITNDSYSINKNDIIVSGITTESTHVITASIEDSYTTVTKSVTVPTVAVTMDYHSSGKGVSFGKVAETQNVLDSAWKIRSSDIPSYAAGNLLSKGADGTISDSGAKASDFADRVSGSTTDFLAKLDADGNLANSLYKSPMQHTLYNSTSGWTKILTWEYVQDCTIRIRGYAGRGYYATRGHWEMLFCVSSDATSHRADLIMATNGVDLSKFDLRTNGSVYTLYFNANGWSHWRIVVDRFRVFPWVSQHNTQETPTGTVVPIFWGEFGCVKLDGDTMTGQLDAPVIRATTDTNASLSSTEHGFQVGSTDKANIAMDGNEIMARNNGAASILYLNADGGDVRVNGKSVYKADDTIPIKDGGTGQTTAALARNALGLGNTTGALPIANGGTGSTSISAARTALNIRTYSGTVSLAANSYYVDVTCSGVTTSSMVWVNHNDAIINTTNPVFVSCRAIGTNSVRIYTIRTRSSATSMPYHILAIG